LNSARAAMEAVGLPMEKFVVFQPTVENQPLLFSNPLKQKLSLAPPSDTLISASKKQKYTI
ncbi:MAG TPA: hypothetical protein PLV31_04330, partial [Gammaproteobacteria bacterium]|nr:hypothetical protein [Gammaproteobacteria bacterium]